jgi:hypothetical protein
MANERHRGRYQEYLAGAGQKIPNKQYAKKAKVGESDGLVIEGGATFTLLPPVPVFVNNIRPVIGGRNQKPRIRLICTRS